MPHWLSFEDYNDAASWQQPGDLTSVNHNFNHQISESDDEAKSNKSYNDSVKLKRTEMDPFRLG